MLTLTAFLERLDANILAQVTDPAGTVIDEVKVTHALADAWGQIEGYLYHLPASDRPPTETLDAHQVSLTLYALAGNRPGVEFDSIAARAKKSIEWLESVAARQPRRGIDTLGTAPDLVYDDASLAKLGDLGAEESS